MKQLVHLWLVLCLGVGSAFAGDHEADVPEMEEVIVTGSKLPQTPGNVTQKISIITSDEIGSLVQGNGNLAEILHGLAKVIRSRFKLFRRVKAITAEAKWSGMFLSVFPLVALVGINVLEPNYYDDVKETAYFIPAALVVAAFLTANIFVMQALVNIKV